MSQTRRSLRLQLKRGDLPTATQADIEQVKTSMHTEVEHLEHKVQHIEGKIQELEALKKELTRCFGLIHEYATITNDGFLRIAAKINPPKPAERHTPPVAPGAVLH